MSDASRARDLVDTQLGEFLSDCVLNDYIVGLVVALSLNSYKHDACIPLVGSYRMKVPGRGRRASREECTDRTIAYERSHVVVIRCIMQIDRN